MDVYHTIIRPLVTEKSTHQAGKQTGQHGGSYSFEVALHAKKAEIKDAVEKVYGVRVAEVRTSIKQGRLRRTRAGLTRTKGMKKAVVVLDVNSHINLF